MKKFKICLTIEPNEDDSVFLGTFRYDKRITLAQAEKYLGSWLYGQQKKRWEEKCKKEQEEVAKLPWLPRVWRKLKDNW